MKKGIRNTLIGVGVVAVVLGGAIGYKVYDASVNMGVNIFTGELSAAGQAKIEENSAADNLELDYEDMFSERDLEQVADLENAVVLNLESNSTVTIDKEGFYVLSGNYTDTMVVVDTDDKAKVQLVLDGLTVENNRQPAIYVKVADKVFVTLSDTDNSLSVLGNYEADGDTNLDAVIYSKSDITFNGTGSLEVLSATENGISSKDDLKITGGTYIVDAYADGIEANDSIRIYDGDITINSEKDAMHSENEDDDSLGYVYIENGNITINAGDDAIRGNSGVIVNGGNINIEECQEGIEASQIIINDGEITIYSEDDGINATFKTSLRAVVEINGGLINVTMSDGDTDGIDSNGDFTINGGEVYVNGGMAAFDVDGVIEYNGGYVYVDGELQDEIETQQVGFGSKFGG